MTVATLKINLNSIKRNWQALDRLSSENTKTAAVVKANAYGLGVNYIAPSLWEAGARTFFVSTAEEGIELRSLIPKSAQIFCLNGYKINDDKIFKHYNIIPIINSNEQLKNFLSLNKAEPIGLHVDTGMNRLGFQVNEINKSLHLIKNLNIVIFMSHLSSADNLNAPETMAQLKTFSRISSFLPKTPLSLSATGGIMHGEAYHFNLTRPGIGIYGGLPFKNAEPVISLKVPVIQVKKIKAGQSVGYNQTFTATTKKKIAIVGAGYADGLFRSLSNKGNLYHKNSPCPIIGRVSMDLITADISHLKQTPNFLEVIGPNQSIDFLAKNANTIGYEILTGLGFRYKRIYYKS